MNNDTQFKSNRDEVRFEEFEVDDIELASKTDRFINNFIDVICFFIFSFLMDFLILEILEKLFNNLMFGFYGVIFNYVLGVIYGTIFFTFLEGTTGSTIGKYITKTKVIDEDGNKPSYETILIRSLCRHIPFDAFSFLGRPGYGWHDKLSKTRVVKV